MMEFQVIFHSMHRVTIEMLNYGVYFADKEYRIYVNGSLYGTSKTVVTTINGLKSDTEYTICVEDEDGQSPEVTVKTDYEFVTLDVKRFGAKGDGCSDDTAFIQAAINCCPKNGRVLISEGVYRISSLFLKSDITIDFAPHSTLKAFTDRTKFPILPGMIPGTEGGESEYNLGTWEGDPEDAFASILTGIYVENVVLTGEGIVDGSASFENWWYEDRLKLGGAYRPRMIFLNHCKNITIQGIRIQNSPAWNIHPYFSDNIRIYDIKINNPKVSPNTDGCDPESVNGFEMVGVSFSLGDDCVAVKSGRIYMGRKYKKPSQNLEIRQCYMHHGHGSVTIGSEMAAGVHHLYVHDCLFEDTDRGLRLKTRRGRGKDAVVEDITFEDIRMEGVKTPFVVNSYYWCCDPDGKTEYVRCKDPLPVDDRTPAVKELHFRNIEAHNCHVAAAFLYGLPEAKIDHLVFENCHMDFAENPEAGRPAMMADVEPCTRKGIYVNNIKKLELHNVTVEGAEGLPIEAVNVDELIQR